MVWLQDSQIVISKYKSGFLPPQDVAFEELTTTGSSGPVPATAPSRDRKRPAIFGRFRTSKVISVIALEAGTFWLHKSRRSAFGRPNSGNLCQLTSQQQQQSFYGPLSGTTRVSHYQKKHSPTDHPDHHPIFISFFRLLRSIASSLFKLRAWQSWCTTSFQVS